MNMNVESSMVILENDLEGLMADSANDEPASQLESAFGEAGFEERLSEMVQKEVDRRFQSAKYQRWAQLENQYGDLSKLRGLAEALLSSGEERPDQTDEPEGDLETRIRSLTEVRD